MHTIYTYFFLKLCRHNPGSHASTSGQPRTQTLSFCSIGCIASPSFHVLVMQYSILYFQCCRNERVCMHRYKTKPLGLIVPFPTFHRKIHFLCATLNHGIDCHGYKASTRLTGTQIIKLNGHGYTTCTRLMSDKFDEILISYPKLFPCPCN